MDRDVVGRSSHLARTKPDESRCRSRYAMDPLADPTNRRSAVATRRAQSNWRLENRAAVLPGTRTLSARKKSGNAFRLHTDARRSVSYLERRDRLSQRSDQGDRSKDRANGRDARVAPAERTRIGGAPARNRTGLFRNGANVG